MGDDPTRVAIPALGPAELKIPSLSATIRATAQRKPGESVVVSVTCEGAEVHAGELVPLVVQVYRLDLLAMTSRVETPRAERSQPLASAQCSILIDASGKGSASVGLPVTWATDEEAKSAKGKLAGSLLHPVELAAGAGAGDAASADESDAGVPASGRVMKGRSALIGIGAGLLAGWGLLALPGAGGRPAEKPLVEDAGRITRVVMHYRPLEDAAAPDAGDVIADIYRRFLRAAGPEIEVLWVVEDEQALDDLKARLGDDYPPKSLMLATGHGITTWSKDRFTCLARVGGRGLTTLLAPARKAVPNPLRTRDQEVPWRLAAAFPRFFECRDMEMDFDGGDILATSLGVFVHPVILSKNGPASSPSLSAEAVRERLRSQLGEFVWLGPAESDVPPHHVGMFLTVANGTAFVGDVRLAERLVEGHEAELEAACATAGGPADAAARSELARQLDCVAGQMQRLGLRVVRVPAHALRHASRVDELQQRDRRDPRRPHHLLHAHVRDGTPRRRRGRDLPRRRLRGRPHRLLAHLASLRLAPLPRQRRRARLSRTEAISPPRPRL